MTDDKDFKKLVRARMSKTGESYAAARAHFRPPTKRSPVEEFRTRMYTRRGIDQLGPHLAALYGIRIDRLTELDVGVFHVVRSDGRDWIARVFPAARPLDHVKGDSEILGALAAHGIPAERRAAAEPVSTLEGQGVLVTEFVPGADARSSTDPRLLRHLGRLLGRLHNLPAPGAMSREAGSWHHLSAAGGGRRNDVDVLLRLLTAAQQVPDEDRATFESLFSQVAAVDGCDDLPKAFTHPQLSGADVIESHAGPVIIDWTGAGVAPRLASFAGLVDGVVQPHPGMPPRTDLTVVDELVAGYAEHVDLRGDELDRLEPAMEAFALILDAWSFLFQDIPLSQIAVSWPGRRARAKAVAERVRAVLADGRRQEPTGHEGQGTLW